MAKNSVLPSHFMFIIVTELMYPVADSYAIFTIMPHLTILDGLYPRNYNWSHHAAIPSSIEVSFFEVSNVENLFTNSP